MKISYRLRRSTKQYIIVSLICILIIGGAAIFTAYIITQQIKEEYELLLAKAHQDMSLNQRNVYVAAADIAAGDKITPDRVVKREVYSSQPRNNFITSKEIGTLALIDIPADTQILYSMVTVPEISSELREVEYQVININSNIDSNDAVDIRIFFQNGEDYVVLPKKVLRGYIKDSPSCFLWLTEEEIIRIRNAIVDAYLYTGAYLYTAKYIEPNIQEASIVTYTPSVEAIELIRKNPNIVDTAMNELSSVVRKALENRLANALKREIAGQSWDIDDDYVYQQYDESEQEISEQADEADSARDITSDGSFSTAGEEKEETMGMRREETQEETRVQEVENTRREAGAKERAGLQEEVRVQEEAVLPGDKQRVSGTGVGNSGAGGESYGNDPSASPDLGAVKGFQGTEIRAEDYFSMTEG